MVRFTVLASGSKGNSTVLCGGRTRLLVDAGLSCRELFRRMKLAGEDPATLNAIIITHEHQDHVNGLAVTARKLGIPVYFTEGTHRAWMRWLSPRRQMSYAQWLEMVRKQAAERRAKTEFERLENELCDPDKDGRVESTVENPVQTQAAALEPESDRDQTGDRVPDEATDQTQDRAFDSSSGLPPSVKDHPTGDGPTGEDPAGEDPAWLPAVEYFQPGEPFSIGDISVNPFTIPHDAADPVGFVFSAEGVRLGFATDLGYIPPNVKEQLRNLDLLLLESNHDLEMLRDGPYPWQVKQRVLSRVGHLSNDATSAFLSEDYDGQAAYIILGHISENNNLPELARVAAERALLGRASLLANRLLLAAQDEALSAISF